MEKKLVVAVVIVAIGLVGLVGLVIGYDRYDINHYIVCQDDMEIEIKENIHVQLLHSSKGIAYADQKICRKYKISNHGERQAMVAEVFPIEGQVRGESLTEINTSLVSLFWVAREGEQTIDLCWVVKGNSPPGKAKLRFNIKRADNPLYAR